MSEEALKHRSAAYQASTRGMNTGYGSVESAQHMRDAAEHYEKAAAVAGSHPSDQQADRRAARQHHKFAKEHFSEASKKAKFSGTPGESAALMAKSKEHAAKFTQLNNAVKQFETTARASKKEASAARKSESKKASALKKLGERREPGAKGAMPEEITKLQTRARELTESARNESKRSDVSEQGKRDMHFRAKEAHEKVLSALKSTAHPDRGLIGMHESSIATHKEAAGIGSGGGAAITKSQTAEHGATKAGSSEAEMHQVSNQARVKSEVAAGRAGTPQDHAAAAKAHAHAASVAKEHEATNPGGRGAGLMKSHQEAAAHHEEKAAKGAINAHFARIVSRGFGQRDAGDASRGARVASEMASNFKETPRYQKQAGEFHLNAAKLHEAVGNKKEAAAHRETAAEHASKAGSEWDESKHPRDKDGKFGG